MIRFNLHNLEFLNYFKSYWTIYIIRYNFCLFFGFFSRDYPLEWCSVAMTLILLLVINGNFYLQYVIVWDWLHFWYYIDWDCLLISFLITVQFETAFLFSFQALYEFGTVFLLEYYTGFGLVLSQVESVSQLYLKKLRSRRKALSFIKSISVLL